MKLRDDHTGLYLLAAVTLATAGCHTNPPPRVALVPPPCPIKTNGMLRPAGDAFAAAASALDRPLPEIKLDRVSLEDALRFVADETNVPIDVAWEPLAPAGVDRATRVSLSVRPNGPAARDVVVEILAAADPRQAASGITRADDPMALIGDDGRLLVTARQDVVDHHMTERRYPLVDLLGRDGATEPLAVVEARMRALIIETVGPETWAVGPGGVGGRADYDGATLVVRQTDEVHAGIDALLTRLR